MTLPIADKPPGRDVPILFSDPMVRSILAGAKTETRRLFKIRDPMGELVPITSPREEVIRMDDGSYHYLSTGGMSGPYPLRWSVGDRLWVREGVVMHRSIPQLFGYRADGARASGCWEKNVTSIHMPRWASRITLLVTDVRVERLQSISEESARAEGAPRCLADDDGKFYQDDTNGTHRTGYAGLWNHINPKCQWDDDPWVVVIKFQQAKPKLMCEGCHGTFAADTAGWYVDPDGVELCPECAGDLHATWKSEGFDTAAVK